MVKDYKDFLNEKHTLAELKEYCRQYKIKGFSNLKKADIIKLIEKAGKLMDMNTEESMKKDKENDAFFDDASAILKIKMPVKKVYPKATKKDMEQFLKDAEITEKKTRKKK